MHFIVESLYLLLFLVPAGFIFSAFFILTRSRGKRLRHFNYAFIIGSFVMVFMKLFFLDVYRLDEPTNSLILKKSASLVSFVVTNDPPDKWGIIVADENRYMGRSLYRAIVTWGWFTFPLIGIVVKTYGALRRKKLRTSTKKK